MSNEERRSHFLLTLPPSDPVPDTRNSYFFFLNLAPTSPIDPVPKRSMVPGSGTGQIQDQRWLTSQNEMFNFFPSRYSGSLKENHSLQVATLIDWGSSQYW